MPEQVTESALADTVAGAVETALTKALQPVVDKLAETSAGSPLPPPLAAPAHQHAKRECGSVIGAFFGLAADAKCDKDKMIAKSKSMYGDDAPITKALTSTTTGGADEFVPITVAREVIEALRPTSVIRQMGPRIIENPTGQIEIPRFSAGVNISWTGEATAVNATQQTTDTVTLTWKKGVIKVPYTRELMLHSAPDVESAIEADVLAAMGQGTDASYIRGATGGNNPVGILNQMAAGNRLDATATVNATNVESDLRRLMQAVLGANVLVTEQTGAWIMSIRSKLFLMNLRDANGYLIFPELRSAEPRMYSYRVFTTNNIPDNLDASTAGNNNESEVYFGAATSILIADATQMSVEMLNNVAYLNSAGTLVSGVDLDTSVCKATLRTDLALRHDVAWSVLEQVTWGV